MWSRARLERIEFRGASKEKVHMSKGERWPTTCCDSRSASLLCQPQHPATSNTQSSTPPWQKCKAPTGRGCSVFRHYPHHHYHGACHELRDPRHQREAYSQPTCQISWDLQISRVGPLSGRSGIRMGFTMDQMTLGLILRNLVFRVLAAVTTRQLGPSAVIVAREVTKYAVSSFNHLPVPG